MKFRGWLLLLLSSTVALPAVAEPEKTLAGRWSASTSRTSWSLDSWGDACGPRPVGEIVPGGIVTVATRGSELTIDGLGRSYSTSTCWESVPGQRITSHGASARAWRTTCQSAAGDPRRVTISTTINATDNRIDFVETGQFEFAIEGQACRASKRRNCTYSLVEREGESRPIPESPPAPVTADTKPALASPIAPQKSEERVGSSCANAGPPARLEVRPTRKLLRAGDEYNFAVRVLDRSGCPLERPVTWKLTQTTTQLEVTNTGVVRVAKDSAEGAATLTASVQDRSVQVTVDVVSESRYQELLQAGTFNDRGETREAAIANITSADVGTKTAVLEETARSRRLIFVAIIGFCALGLGAAALWMALGRRRDRSNGPAIPLMDSRDAAPMQEMLVCPTCQEEYPAETKFCARDGNRLVPLPNGNPIADAEGGICPVCGQGFDPGITVCPNHDEELVPPAAVAHRQVQPTPAPRRICPLCGTVYGTEHQFCGNDGAALVPIN